MMMYMGLWLYEHETEEASPGCQPSFLTSAWKLFFLDTYYFDTQYSAMLSKIGKKMYWHCNERYHHEKILIIHLNL